MAETPNYNNYFEARGISAEFYDTYRLPPYLLAILGQNTEISILDFGCGFGQNLLAFRKLGFANAQGFDIEPTALDFCQAKELAVIDGRKSSLNLHQNQYDLVIITHVLEHLPKADLIDQLKALRLTLKDGGRLFVAVPNAQSHTGSYWMYEDFTHQTLFTAGSLFFVLRQAGYSQVKVHDKDCLMGLTFPQKTIRKFFLALYRLNNKFWNKVTGSSYHLPSPIVNSYEIKMIAEK